MKPIMRVVAVASLLLIATTPLAAQETFASAKELYAAASYEEALSILDSLLEAEPPVAESHDIQQYRVFCLLALKRQDEAERAIEALVRLDPFFRPQESDAAPWIQSSFQQVRRRILPSVAQAQFSEARSAFGRKEYGQASEQLKLVLAMLDDPDIAPIVANQNLADLRVLAQGFLDLSQAAAAVPAPPDSEASPPSTAASPPPSQASSVKPAADADGTPVLRIYTALDKDVTPPVPTSQRLPQWPSGLMTFLPAATGLLELVIDETGRVESVALRQSLNRIYDALLVEAAKAWRYKPAVKEGQPVKFRKLVEIVSPVRPAAREGGWVS